MKQTSKTRVIDEKKNKDVKIQILKQKAQFLYDIGKPFKLVKSGGSYEIKSGFWNETASRGGFTFKDMTFIKRVKEYVDKNGIAINFIDKDYKAEKIDYVKVGSFKPGEVIKDMVCIDVDYAYWQTAYNLGIIDKAIYKRGLSEDISKVVRLAALGSLAKNKTVWDFDGKTFKREAVINSKTTENLWFAICKTVGDLMAGISRKLGSDFVFYWVDGIYIKDDSRSMAVVLDAFKACHYGAKIEYISWVEFEEHGFTVKGDVNADTKHFDYSLVKVPVSRYEDVLEERRLLAVAQEVVDRANKRKKS